MLVAIPNLLTPQQVAHARQKLDAAKWTDGAATAGVLAKKVKRNRQIDQSHPVGREIGQMILNALGSNETFVNAARPLKVMPPKFNRYEGGEHYGAHIDNAIMDIPGSGGLRLRADLSMTVFFSEPGEYDGGELRVLDTYGHKAITPGRTCHPLHRHEPARGDAGHAGDPHLLFFLDTEPDPR
jgi:PKHD-type hydroxylase